MSLKPALAALALLLTLPGAGQVVETAPTSPTIQPMCMHCWPETPK